MDNKKGFIKKNKLKEIIYQYIKSDLIKVELRDSYWSHNSYMNEFNFAFGSPREYDSRVIGCTLISSEELRWVIYIKDPHSMDGSIPVIIIFEDTVEFIDDAKFTIFSKEFMYNLYLQIKEVVENVTDSSESNNESVTGESNVNESKPVVENKNSSGIENYSIPDGGNNKHVYILAIDACPDLPTYTFLIKAENKDEAFEIFWNRYKDFPETDIDTKFGGIDRCGDRSTRRLHKERFIRIDENTMESKEEMYSTVSIKLCDTPKGVHIDDDITYILEVY